MEEVLKKKCSKCDEVKSIDDFHVRKQALRKDGTRKSKLDIYCKKCKREYLKEYRKKNKEKINNRNRAYIANNKKQILEKRKYYRDTLKDTYIKVQLLNNGFPSEVINENLIETKRIILKTKRLCKTSQS